MNTGELKMSWARQYMPVLGEIRKRFEADKPLSGTKIAMALHVEAKTAVLVETLAAGGAEVYITGCNPLSTQDDVAKALDSVKGVHCYAKRACSVDEYYAGIDKVLDANPTVTIDDGMDLIHRLHTERRELLDNITGGCEETTTGIHRLRSMASDGKLEFPVIAVNDTPMKRCFDNVHGTGESALSAVMITTNTLVGGKWFVVAGYGYCGRGLAKMAHGLGAKVIVTEVDPRRALEAHMDGYHVMTMDDAAKIGDIFVTTTGNTSIITGKHFPLMKSGAILSNAGHFNVEIDIPWLEEHKESLEQRDGIDTYTINGKKISVLAEGRLVNLAVPKGMGHPVEVMDLSFALQALCSEYIKNEGPNLVGGVYEVPNDIDITVATLKLSSLGVSIDRLSEYQEKYMTSWDIGT
ncbi:MAG: adenosylhomocysteinase [Methanomicrobiaceae archaeon]|nr:adenosylhomocysteinase [Methanomicrobiaceae archaeon]